MVLPCYLVFVTNYLLKGKESVLKGHNVFDIKK